MALKPKHSPDSDPSLISKPTVLSGPWGRINSSPRSVDVVRFCQGKSSSNQKNHSYPYRYLSSWHWTKAGEEEELNIKAGADLITVKGRGLDRIVDALDQGVLETLVEAGPRELDEEQFPIII